CRCPFSTRTVRRSGGLCAPCQSRTRKYGSTQMGVSSGCAYTIRTFRAGCRRLWPITRLPRRFQKKQMPCLTTYGR
ncbi:hypothetical protein EV176_005177, partial [Coemansia sp. RSA 451]